MKNLNALDLEIKEAGRELLEKRWNRYNRWRWHFFPRVRLALFLRWARVLRRM